MAARGRQLPRLSRRPYRWGDWGSRPWRWLLHPGWWNVVGGHRPRASRRSSREALRRAGRVAGRDRHLRGRRGGSDRAEARVASEPEALVASCRGLGLALERIGLEACSLSAWLYEGLAAAGLPAVCIETRRAKAAMGAMPNKTDRNDARGIAQIMRTGWYRA